MNGDWMEYEDQGSEMSESGPLLSSYHYILDVTLLGEIAEILGEETIAATYKAKAKHLWPEFNEVYLKEQAPMANNTGKKTSTCDTSVEMKKGGHVLKLGCHEAGATIAAVTFAGLGTIGGNCADGLHMLRHNASCSAPGVMDAVAKLCVGKPSCELTPIVGPTSAFAKTDPCKGVIKTLAVSINCSGSAPPPPPGPPAPPPPAPSPLYGYATPGQAAGQLEQVVMLGRAEVAEAVIPATHRADVEQTLLRSIAAADNHITTGFIGNKYAWPAVTAMGRAALAVDLALETTAPSYGYQIAKGATTLWEDWSGTDVDSTAPETGEGPSHNHHFMGGIGQWLATDLVGLSQPAGSVAHSHPLIAPAVVNHTDLPSAAGTFWTSRGELKVAWEYKREATRASVALEVTLPPNTAGTVMIPCATAEVTEGGKAVWKDGKYQAGAVAGVVGALLAPSRDGGNEEHVALAVGSGEYAFHAVCA
jgi:hypothetical protein